MTHGHHSALPTHSTQGTTADPNFAGADEDPSEVTKLFEQRISAYGDAVDNLEDYVKATEKDEHAQGKAYDKLLKTISHPLKDGHQFDPSANGISGMFVTIRTKTEGLSHSHNETSKAIKSQVLPTFESLSKELKTRGKEVSKSAGKGSKAVDKARTASQKHIEKLGLHTAAFDGNTSKGLKSANDDPYVLHRGIFYRLKNQIDEENNNREDLIGIQNQFAQFEAHIVTQLQQAMQQFDQIMAQSADRTRNLYTEMSASSTRIPPDFEWNGFINRNRQVLIDPREPKRTLESMGFANQNHASTQAIIAGTLDRKSKVLKKYEPGFYAVTPSKYLHEFKTNDNFAKDPVPENSLFLPDCMIGALDGLKFAVKGKDASKGGIGQKLSMSHEYQFQAQDAQDAQKWYDAIRAVAGQTNSDMPDSDADSRGSSRVGTGMEGAGLAGAGAGAAGTHQTGHTPVSQTSQTGQTMPGQVTGQQVPGQAGLGQTVPGQVPDQSYGQNLPGHTMPGHTVPGQTAMPGQGIPTSGSIQPISTQGGGGLGDHPAAGTMPGSAVSGHSAVPGSATGTAPPRM